MAVRRRLAALVALLAPAGAVTVLVAALVERPLVLLGAVGGVYLAVGAAANAVTRAGLRRTAAAAAAVAALAAPIALLVASADLVPLAVVVALSAATGAAARVALGRDLASLRSGPPAGVAVPRATQGFLLLNPKSGGGKVGRFGLVEQARRRGVEAMVLAPGDDARQVADDAVARGADVLGVAGGDGSLAQVAEVAMRHDLAFVCVPAGTRNHLAMDLGLDRDDVVGALDAFGEAVERRVDLGQVGDRIFVNNVALGLYARIVASPAYRDHKVRTALELLPEMIGPDGAQHPTAHLVMVANDRYEMTRGDGFGSRRRLDAGTLGLTAASVRSSDDLAQLVRLLAVGRVQGHPGWLDWSDTGFEVRSAQAIEAGVDGESLLLDPPLRFRSLPGALRVRVPRHAPGYSAAAAALRPGRDTLTALLQVVAGRPVTLDG